MFFVQKQRKIEENLEVTLEDFLKAIKNNKGTVNNGNESKDYQAILPAIEKIVNNLDTIFILNPNQQIILINDINSLLKNVSENLKKLFNMIISKYFDWDTFIAFIDEKHLLSNIYNDLGIGICPYCNRNYTSIVEIKLTDEQKKNFKYLYKESKKDNNQIKYVLPSFDHFFPKSQYPYLALTLWNLVPTCTYCNSKFKLKRDTVDYSKNKTDFECLHPYIEGFNNNEQATIRFELELPEDTPGAIYSAVAKTNQSAEFYELFSIEFITNSQDINYKSRAINSIKMFALYEVYNQIHKRDAVDTAIKTIYLNKAYTHSLYQILNDYTKDSTNYSPPQSHINKVLEQKNIYQHLEYLAHGHLNECDSKFIEPLAKLKSDIIHQFSVNSTNHTYDWLQNNYRKRNNTK